MSEIRVFNINKCELNSLKGNAIFYRCNPDKEIQNVTIIDIVQDVFTYIDKEIKSFNSYVRNYIQENKNDARITMSRLFEFDTCYPYANSALEIIAIKKAISSLQIPEVNLIVPKEYNVELLKSAFDSSYNFRIKKIWVLKRSINIIFYFSVFLPLVLLKRLVHGGPAQANILFLSFIIGDVQLGFKIDPYFSTLISELKKQGASVNRFATFGLISVFNTLKNLWGLDTREFILPEAFLGINEIWKSYKLCNSIKNSEDLQNFYFDGCDLKNYMKALSLYIYFRTVQFRYDLMRKYIKKANKNYRVIIIQHENFFYQFGLFEEAKRSLKNVFCISYQFSQLNSYRPNHYYILPEEYQSDIILTSGKYYADFMIKKLGYPQHKIKEAYSLHIPQGIKYKRSEKPIICVYVSDIYYEAIAIRNYILTNLSYPHKEFRIGIRFHPYTPKKIICMFDKIDYFEYSDAEESLFKSDCFLSAGESTIIFSAAMTKKPVYLLNIPNVPRWFDCHSLNNIKYIKVGQPINVQFFSSEDYIEEDNGVSIEETCKEIIRLTCHN